MSEKNIHQRMAAVTAELQTVAKNLSIEPAKGKSYKAVSERDVLDAVKPIENKHGIYSYPASRRLVETSVLESESVWNGNVTKKTTFFERIETVYRFVNVDNPADFIDMTTFSVGIDNQDKGSGKAMTYADKYALMKAYKISTGDDPDQTPSDESRYMTKAKNNRVVPPTCTNCGATIESTTNRNGEVWDADRIVEYSMKRFDRVLCPKCQRVAFKTEGNN